MIYRLETGVDREISKNLITLAIILAVTVALPALAALVNQVSPFTSSIDPGDVMGTNTDNATEPNSQPDKDKGEPDKTGDETAATATTGMPMPGNQAGLSVADTFSDSTYRAGSTTTASDQTETDYGLSGGTGSATAPSKSLDAGSSSLPLGGAAPDCLCYDGEEQPAADIQPEQPPLSNPDSSSPQQNNEPDSGASLNSGLGELLEVEADLKPANKDDASLKLDAKLLNTPIIY